MQRIIFCILISIGFSLTLVAQEIDGLKNDLDSPDELVQISALQQLSIAYNQISLDTAVLYGRDALILSQKIKNDSLQGVSHSRLSLSYYYQRNYDSLVVYADRGAKLAESINIGKMQAYCLKMLALGYNYKGNFEKAIETNVKSLKVYQSLNDTSGIAATYSNIGRIYQQTGEYSNALEYLFKAENLFVEIQDVYGRGVAAAQIGDLYLDMEDLSKGAFYIKKALNLTDKDAMKIRYADLLVSLGSIYHLDPTKLDSAKICFVESLEYFTEIGDEEGKAIGHKNLGNVYRDEKQWDKSLYNLHEARKIELENGWKKGLLTTYKDLGNTYEMSKRINLAEEYYLKAYEMSKTEVVPHKKEEVLKSVYEFYKNTTNPKEALHFYELYITHLNKIKGEDLQKEVVALETKYESEKKDRAIERLELQSAVSSAKTNALRIGLGGLTAILGLALFGIWYKRKNEQKLFTLKQKMHEQEKHELDQELNYKSKQLTSHALHMVQKNKVLQEIKHSIEELVIDSSPLNNKTLRGLINRINFSIQSDEDWNTFKIYFEETNQDFYKNLYEINDNLTSTEIKLCSLIKLNLNIKETASVLNIEPTSVKTARHRLRKKLFLPQGQDLNSFIGQVF